MKTWAWLLVGLAACTPPRDRAIEDVKRYVGQELEALHDATVRLRQAAPEASDGWSLSTHREAVLEMRAAWSDARDAYERIEGAIGMLFPHYDVSVDERYEAFIAVRPDRNLFDDDGVTGMHAVERILWAGEHSDATVRFERSLPYYEPASFPSTAREASEFRELLLARLERECLEMRDTFRSLALDPAAAFRGLLGSIEEQQEKVALGGTGEGESRYANRTLADMRANLEGGVHVFAAIAPWLLDEGGAAEDVRIRAGFERLQALYDGVEGDALPEVPAGWPEEGGERAFGRLHEDVRRESDPEGGGLMRDLMRAAERVDAAVLPRI